MNFGRSAICTASCPDSARTGYPGTYQWYDAKKKVWRWIFVGSPTRYATPTQVERQANLTSHIKIGTRVRFVYVRRWKRVQPKGWKPHIKFVIEAKKTMNGEVCPCRD